MKKLLSTKFLLIGLLALALLAGAAFTAVKTITPKALAAGPITSQSLASSSGVLSGPEATVIISTTEGAYEFTPYKLSIPNDSAGINWVNQTDEQQTIISNVAGIKPLVVPAHKSGHTSLLTKHGDFDFHLKVNYNVPHCVVSKLH